MVEREVLHDVDRVSEHGVMLGALRLFLEVLGQVHVVREVESLRFLQLLDHFDKGLVLLLNG